MPKINDISTRIDELNKILDRATEEYGQNCENTISGGVSAGAYPAQAELDDVRKRAEDIKSELAAIKHKGKLDPAVRDLENKLDQVLSRYYWLWQKCKASMA